MVLNCMGGLEGLRTGGELVVMNPANNLKFSRFINAMVFAIFCHVEIIELRNYKAIECIFVNVKISRVLYASGVCRCCHLQ